MKAFSRAIVVAVLLLFIVFVFVYMAIVTNGTYEYGDLL